MSNTEIIKKGNELANLLKKTSKASVNVRLVWPRQGFTRTCLCPSRDCPGRQAPETPTVEMSEEKTFIKSETGYYLVDDGGWGKGNVAYPEHYFTFGLILKQNSTEFWKQERTARGTWDMKQSFKFLLGGHVPVEDKKVINDRWGKSEIKAPEGYLHTPEEAVKITNFLLDNFIEQVEEVLNKAKEALS